MTIVCLCDSFSACRFGHKNQEHETRWQSNQKKKEEEKWKSDIRNVSVSTIRQKWLFSSSFAAFSRLLFFADGKRHFFFIHISQREIIFDRFSSLLFFLRQPEHTIDVMRHIKYNNECKKGKRGQNSVWQQPNWREIRTTRPFSLGDEKPRAEIIEEYFS